MTIYELRRLEQRDLIKLIDDKKLVLITRCKDCRHWRYKQQQGTLCDGICSIYNISKHNSGYCELAERKGNGK